MYVEGPGTSGADFAVSAATYEEYHKLARAEDRIGILDLHLAGLLFRVDNGTECRVIDRQRDLIEVRIREGDHMGRRGFIFHQLLKQRN